jgi:hypothetical protein
MKIKAAIIATVILSFSSMSWAMMPPKYLSVKSWKHCVSKVNRDSAKFICLPNAQPFYCPDASWHKLNEMHLVDNC